MNHRSETIAKYAEYLDSQIEGLEHNLSVVRGELTVARILNLTLQRRIDALELAAADRGADGK
jgi:hypothetical protein